MAAAIFMRSEFAMPWQRDKKERSDVEGCKCLIWSTILPIRILALVQSVPPSSCSKRFSTHFWLRILPFSVRVARDKKSVAISNVWQCGCCFQFPFVALLTAQYIQVWWFLSSKLRYTTFSKANHLGTLVQSLTLVKTLQYFTPHQRPAHTLCARTKYTAHKKTALKL